MNEPDPRNDDLGLDDTDMIAEIKAHAEQIAEDEDEDVTVWALRMCRMRDLIQEYFGKPIDHEDFVAEIEEREE